MTRRLHRPIPRPLGWMVAACLALGGTGCATQASPASDPQTAPATAFTQLGEAYLEQGNLPRAMTALDRALSLDPDAPEALQAMAMVYQGQGDRELADHHFQMALEEAPSFTRARNNYAAFLYDQGRIAEACQQLEQATQDTHYAHRAQLYANLGRCRWELGQEDAASDALKRAQAIDSRHPLSYLTLAELEYAQGNLMRARSQLDTYLRLAGPSATTERLADAIAAAATAPRSPGLGREVPSAQQTPPSAL